MQVHVFSGCCMKDQYGRVQLYYLVINSSIVIEGWIISKKLAVKVQLMSMWHKNFNKGLLPLVYERAGAYRFEHAHCNEDPSHRQGPRIW